MVIAGLSPVLLMGTAGVVAWASIQALKTFYGLDTAGATLAVGISLYAVSALHLDQGSRWR